MTEKQRRDRLRGVKRDTVIVGFGLAWGTLELLFLGARPQALTFIMGILVSPGAIRLDEARRRRRSSERET